MKRPYYIPPILTAAAIALAMLFSVTGSGGAGAPEACALSLDSLETSCPN